MRPIIFLAVLLVPFFSYGQNTDQIKELKFKKEIEISDLGKIIAEKYKYAQSIREEAINILNKESYKKNLNEQEIKESGARIDEELNAFIVRLNNTTTMNGFLSKELFKKDEQLEEDFEAVKFFLIIIINEYRIIKTLIGKYEVLEQERREIDQNLANSQQQ